MSPRYAVITNSRVSLEVILRYLPANYTAIDNAFDNDILIVGHDNYGWTLDTYVIPRLASGLIFAHEVFLADPNAYTPHTYAANTDGFDED